MSEAPGAPDLRPVVQAAIGQRNETFDRLSNEILALRLDLAEARARIAALEKAAAEKAERQ